MTGEIHAASNAQTPFHGFESLEANFVFCPNQFFDLVIPNHSRPVVRLVSYILHQTLRWLDEDGHPVRQDIAISFNDLVQKAGIARGSIRRAIAEAVNAKLIQCIVKGHSKSQGQPGRVGEYSLCWDETGHYAKSVDGFKGFYVGNGNRSPIPHSFFDQVLPNEPLAVTKVVGTVLRHTVGYQNQYGGGRRTEAQLPFKMIHRYAQIASPATVADAIRQAIASNYVRRVRAGRFSPNSNEQTSAVYAINWLSNATCAPIGSKNEVGDRFKFRSSPSVQKTMMDESKIRSSKSSKTEAADRFKNRITINNQSKNQQTTDVAAQSIELLTKTGFDPSTARSIASKATTTQIANQIAWLRYRTVNTNRLGLLRKALEENWPEPTAAINKRRADKHWRQTQAEQEASDQREREQQQVREQWIRRWLSAPAAIRSQCKLKAIRIESNPVVRKRLEQKSIDEPPHPNVMLAFQESSLLPA